MNTSTRPLNRQLSQPLLILYGLGTTIGAGIYALLSDIAATAGAFAPWSFLLASILASFTAISFAELSNRYPRAGATALYIESGFSSKRFATLIGLLLVCSAVTSSAALLNGLVGYAQVLLPASREVIITAILLLVTLVCLWGISQSAWLAGAISLLEIGGVIWLTSVSSHAIDFEQIDLASLIPTTNDSGVIFAGAVMSFYAYIGFEDMVEVAEEVLDVRRTLPRAILWTLGITSVLYLVLMVSTQLAVGTEFLAAADAPFADIYRELTQSEPFVFMAIGLLAILNGVLIQLIMASRVLYGLASRNALPDVLAVVSEQRQTPTVATLVVAAAILTLALAGTLGDLATITSLIMLTVFGLANLALWRIKGRRQVEAIGPLFRIPRLIPLAGSIICFGFVAQSMLSGMS